MMTNNFNQEQLEKMTKQASQQAEDMMKFGQAGFDAWIKSTNIFMDNTQTMMKSMTDLANQTRETQSAAMKELMACKTLNDVTETSTKLAQQTMEQTMSQATDLTEKTIKTCMDCMEPINEQMTKGFQTTMKKASKAA